MVTLGMRIDSKIHEQIRSRAVELGRGQEKCRHNGNIVGPLPPDKLAHAGAGGDESRSHRSWSSRSRAQDWAREQDSERLERAWEQVGTRLDLAPDTSLSQISVPPLLSVHAPPKEILHSSHCS